MHVIQGYSKINLVLLANDIVVYAHSYYEACADTILENDVYKFGWIITRIGIFKMNTNKPDEYFLVEFHKR